MDPIFPGSLYVKQDIYRIMIMTFVYFGVFSFAQASIYGYGMAIVFISTALPFIHAIKKINKG